MISSLSVFFPAYNEAANIRSTVEKALNVLKGLEIKNFEILVIDDGSTDNTKEIVSQLEKEDKRIKWIGYLPNRGYGYALKTGYENSRYPWVFFSDSDGQFDFKDIEKLLSFTDRADLILGYRIQRADSFSRTMYTFGWSVLARIVLGLDVKDYSCGFKLMRKKVYEDVSPLVTGEKVTQIELLVKAKRKKYRFAEVGVNHYPRNFGKQTGANPSVVIKSIIDLFRLWWVLR